MTIIPCESQEVWVQSAVELIIKDLLRDIQLHGAASLALSGGSTPYPVYEALALDKRIDWSKIGLIQVDERYVPIGDPEYNWSKVTDAVGSDVIMRSPLVCTFDTTLSPEESLHYMNTCSPESLSVAILGMGTDGHIASLFPGGPWDDHGSKTLATEAPDQYKTQKRLSLSAEYLMKSESIVLLIQGEEKTSLIQDVLKSSESDLPVGILLSHPNVQVVQI